MNIPVVIRITYTGWVAELMNSTPQRFVRKVTRAGFQAMGDYWAKRMLPTHFKVHAFHEYAAYKPRAAKYVRWKRAHVGHNRPLVLSGDTERMARAGATVRAVYNRVRITMPVPSYFKKHPAGSQINKPEELTDVSVKEAVNLAAVCQKAIIEEIRRMRGARKQLTIGFAAA